MKDKGLVDFLGVLAIGVILAAILIGCFRFFTT